MNFESFYIKIRDYFSLHSSEYEAFKSNSSASDKLLFLLHHKVVKECLFDLDQNYISLDFIREKQRQKERKTKDKDDSLIKGLLPNKTHSLYPFMSEKLEIQFSESKGRHVIAKEKIKPGEVLIAERSYVSMLYSSFGQSHCQLCFKRLSHLKHRCLHCMEIAYCSKDCEEEFKEIHESECGFVNALQSESIGSNALLALRTVTTIGFESLVTKNFELYSEYGIVSSQITHEKQRQPGEIFKRLCVSLYIGSLLRSKSFYPQELMSRVHSSFWSIKQKSEPLFIFLISLVRHLESNSCNAYEINELVHNNSSILTTEQLGGAIYPTVSLTNHSCAPNTFRNSLENIVILRASTLILPGEEIHDNYGHHFLTKELSQRQEDLRTQYFFDCDCIACKEFWPNLLTLRENYKDSHCIPFVCEICRSSLRLKGSKTKCNQCHRKTEIGKIKGSIDSLQKNFSFLLSQLSVSRLEDESLLKTYTCLLEELRDKVRHPCLQYIMIQQIVCQIYGLQGNVSQGTS